MDGFEVPVEALSAAGRTGASAADGLAGLPLMEIVAAVGTALPGAAAGAAAAALDVAWRARLTAATDAVARQAGALQIAADGYHAAERGAVASLVGER
jgi:hypothetical protein